MYLLLPWENFLLREVEGAGVLASSINFSLAVSKVTGHLVPQGTFHLPNAASQVCLFISSPEACCVHSPSPCLQPSPLLSNRPASAWGLFFPVCPTRAYWIGFQLPPGPLPCPQQALLPPTLEAVHLLCNWLLRAPR